MSSVGKKYRYVASHARAMGRYNQIVTVLEWHYTKALVRFPDGCTVLTPGRCLRKVKP